MANLKALLLEMLILANYHWYLTHSQLINLNVNLGALLSSSEMEVEFNRYVVLENKKKSNTFLGTNNQTFRLNFIAVAQTLNMNALKAAHQVCEIIQRSSQLFAVIVSHPQNQNDLPPLSTSFTCAFYNIPVIGVTARESALSDKYSHSSFLRTVPPYSQEAVAWGDLIRRFGWQQVIFIHSDDEEGSTLLSQLQRTSNGEAGEEFSVRSVPYQRDSIQEPNFYDILRPIRQDQTRSIVLDAGIREAGFIFSAAANLSMFDRDWSWIVSDQALAAHNVPQGVISLQLSQGDEKLHIQDAVAVAVEGIKAYLQDPTLCKPGDSDDACPLSNTKTPKNCNVSIYSDDIESPPDSGWPPKRKKQKRVKRLQPWPRIGEQLFKKLIGVKLSDGKTGRVEFDHYGNRLKPLYSILNTQFADSSNSPERIIKVNVGTYGREVERPAKYDLETKFFPLLQIDMRKIRWPGNDQIMQKKNVCIRKSTRCLDRELQTVYLAPKSFKKKTTLRVVTKLSTPFVDKRDMPVGGCNVLTSASEVRGEVECTKYDNITKETKTYCCYGYCVDLLRRLANRTDLEKSFTPFNYTLYIVADNKVGEEIKNPNAAGVTEWTGIMGELLNGKADLAVAPTTISPSRAKFVAFTKPFKYLGLTILVKRNPPKSNLASFLQPFEKTLWVLVALSVHVVALVLYLLDRFSPFGRFKLAKSSDTEEDALNLSSAMWFAWGVLLNSGIGEGTPRSFSARVLGMVWAGFAMIIVASYTANLAAFLVLDRPEASITGIDDARLRNPQKDFKFATVRGSPVEEYFQRQVEYTTMYRHMEQNNYENPESAIKDVEAGKENGLKAFIWDSARLNFEAAKNCDLVTAGDVFGRTGYGLAMPMNSPWLEELSQAVLNFHERGFMESLDSEWILTKAEKCKKAKTARATLGLTNMAGVFIMVAAGIVAGVFLIFIEIAYKKRRGLKEKELELAKTAADRWRGNIEKRKILRRTLAAERAEAAKESGQTDDNDIIIGLNAELGVMANCSRVRPNGRTNQPCVTVEYDSCV